MPVPAAYEDRLSLCSEGLDQVLMEDTETPPPAAIRYLNSVVRYLPFTTILIPLAFSGGSVSFAIVALIPLGVVLFQVGLALAMRQCDCLNTAVFPKTLDLMFLLYWVAIVVLAWVPALGVPLPAIVEWRSTAFDVFTFLFIGVGNWCGRPFTAEYAKDLTPSAGWKKPLFVTINRHLSWVWTAAFFVRAIVGAAGVLTDNVFLKYGWVLVTVAAIKYTRTYPESVKRKLALEPRQTECAADEGASVVSALHDDPANPMSRDSQSPDAPGDGFLTLLTTVCDIIGAKTLHIAVNVWIIFTALMMNNFFTCLPEGEACNDRETEGDLATPLLLMAAYAVIPLYRGRRPFVIGSLIFAEITGWAWVGYLRQAEWLGTPKSIALALAIAVPASVLYYAVMNFGIRRLPAYANAVGPGNRDTWEALEDYDKDVISYMIGFLLYNLGLRLFLDSACDGCGGDEAQHLASAYGTSMWFGFATVSGVFVFVMHTCVSYLSRSDADATGVVEQCLVNSVAVALGFILIGTSLWVESIDESPQGDSTVGQFERKAGIFIAWMFVVPVLLMTYRAVTARKETPEKQTGFLTGFQNCMKKYRKKVTVVTFPLAIGYVFEAMVEVSLEELKGYSALAVYGVVGGLSIVGIVKTARRYDLGLGLFDEDRDGDGDSERLKELATSDTCGSGDEAPEARDDDDGDGTRAAGNASQDL